MTIYEILTDPVTGAGMPCAYSHFQPENAPENPPYLVYIGNGQTTFQADNTHYYAVNNYQLEYYFADKDEEAERKIERLLLDHGYLYEKSADVYIEDAGVFVIYYYI